MRIRRARSPPSRTTTERGRTRYRSDASGVSSPGSAISRGLWKPRVDRPPPAARRALLDLEVERLVVRVDHDVEVAVALRCAVQAISDAVRVEGQVDARPDPVPADVVAPELRAADGRVGLAKCDHPLRESKMVGMHVLARPVQPGRLVVLVVRVVIPPLGPQELVAGPEHRDPVGQEQQAEEVLRLPLAEGHDRGGHVLIPLPAAVPAQVLRRPVGVPVAVGPVPLLVVGDCVVECEAVVAGDVIDRLKRPAAHRGGYRGTGRRCRRAGA